MKLRDLLLWIPVGLLLSACVLFAVRATADSSNLRPPVKVIVDTDMFGDCDDVGAMAVLHKLADNGEVEILATIINSNNKEKAVGASVDAVNTYYGRPNIPLGAYHGNDAKLRSSTYTAQLRDEFPHDAPADGDLPSGVSVYRRILSQAADGEVVIISIGFLFNLRDLLNSPADDISPLTGEELIRKKVREVVMMGGQFPASDPQKGEFNFAWTQPKCAQEVMAHWPTPVLLSGWEIGGTIICGQPLAATPRSNPVRRAYELFPKNCLLTGRYAFDLTAILAAVRDPELYWSLSEPGVCVVADNGSNTWRADPKGLHRYLIRKVPDAEMAQVFDDFLVMPPKGGFPPVKVNPPASQAP